MPTRKSAAKSPPAIADQSVPTRMRNGKVEYNHDMWNWQTEAGIRKMARIKGLDPDHEVKITKNAARPRSAAPARAASPKSPPEVADQSVPTRMRNGKVEYNHDMWNWQTEEGIREMARIKGLDPDHEVAITKKAARPAESAPAAGGKSPREIASAALSFLQLRTFAQVPFTREEKQRVRELLTHERQAVRAGKDCGDYTAERERITAAARKRGPKQPSAAARASATRLQQEKPNRQGGGRSDRTKGVKKTGLLGLPSVVVRTFKKGW